MKKKAYAVLEIGWEYNDEYFSTGNYGETYEAPKEIFLDEEKAKAEWLKKEIEAYRGNELMGYVGEQDLRYALASGVFEEDLKTYYKEVFDENLDLDDLWELSVPKNASDEQIIGLIKLMKIRFYKVHETTITE